MCVGALGKNAFLKGQNSKKKKKKKKGFCQSSSKGGGEVGVSGGRVSDGGSNAPLMPPLV